MRQECAVLFKKWADMKSITRATHWQRSVDRSDKHMQLRCRSVRTVTMQQYPLPQQRINLYSALQVAVTMQQSPGSCHHSSCINHS